MVSWVRHVPEWSTREQPELLALMMILVVLCITSAIIAYAVGAVWAFGYLAGKDGKGESQADYRPDHGLDYYLRSTYNGKFYWQSIFWIFVWLWSIPKPLLYYIAQFGYKRGVSDQETRDQRVEIERRVRIQLMCEKREAEKETEEVLTKDSAHA